MKKTRAAVFAIAGALVSVLSIGELLSVRAFVARAARAPGTVVRLNAGGAHPEVAFHTEGGETISYPQNGLVSGFAPGDAVTVLYDPEQPREACIDHPGALWGFPLLFTALGGAFLTAAWATWR